jgi:hypothetical protein
MRMFDPFGDFEIVGYLQNTGTEKDLEVVKVAEHALFRCPNGCCRGLADPEVTDGYAAFVRKRGYLST